MLFMILFLYFCDEYIKKNIKYINILPGKYYIHNAQKS